MNETVKPASRLQRVEILISADARAEIKRRAKADLRSERNFLTLDLERIYVSEAKSLSDCPKSVQPEVWRNANEEQRRAILKSVTATDSGNVVVDTETFLKS